MLTMIKKDDRTSVKIKKSRGLIVVVFFSNGIVYLFSVILITANVILEISTDNPKVVTVICNS